MSFISCLETWRSDRQIFPNSRYGYPRGGYHITGVNKKLSRNITSVRRWAITNLFLECMFCILAFIQDCCVHLLPIQIKFLCLIICCLYARVSMYNFKINAHAEKRTHGNGMQHITVHVQCYEQEYRSCIPITWYKKIHMSENNLLLCYIIALYQLLKIGQQ